MIALAVGILVVLALAYLLAFVLCRAADIPTPRPPELDESREAAGGDAAWKAYVGAPYKWHSS